MYQNIVFLLEYQKVYYLKYRYLFEINDTSIINFEYVGYVPSADPSILEVKEYGAGDAQRLVYFNTNLLHDGVNLFYRVKTSVLNKKYKHLNKYKVLFQEILVFWHIYLLI